ncbi:MAG: hypothetical protein ACLFTG_04475 [Alphaproteobacteria bacterium]
MPVPAEILGLGIWVVLAATAALLIFARTGRRLDRVESTPFAVGHAASIGGLAAPARPPHQPRDILLTL